MTSDIWNSVFEDVMRKGTGPAYMDCSDATDEQMAYMRWAMTGEGLTASRGPVRPRSWGSAPY